MATLDDSLQFLKGVGPARAAALATAGWRTAWDVLHTFPRLLGPPPPLAETGLLAAATVVRLRARLLVAKPRFGRGHGMALEATLVRADGLPLTARFFNAGYLRRMLLPGEWYLWEGKTDAGKATTLLHPSFQHLPGGPASPLPVEPGCRVAYHLPEGIGERVWAGVVGQLIVSHLPCATDPAEILPPAAWQAQLLAAHQPTDAEQHEAARRALAERELLALAWTLHARRAAVVTAAGRALRWDDTTHARALARLPFTLTPGQQTALAEIRADATRPAPMYRLLQGDVGSGKTALALITALAAIADGRQAVLLAPTAVLAQQHLRFLNACLAGTKVRCASLTGGTPSDERAVLLQQLADGTCHLVVGTHALLEEAVRFRDLAVVVIDEQHKFGVHQRAALVDKAALRPHLLLMTATPIPRTLALTAFGDLAVSRIAGRPPGRAAVTTTVQAGAVPAVKQALKQLAAGDQALVVCALRNPGDEGKAHDAGSVFTALSASEPAIALLHGAMPEAEKLAVMERFRSGAVRVLVSTTVVEVGIDVPTLALLAVLDAERFGLAQLHQLRGRLGRGDRPGTCLLLHAPKAEVERLAILAASDDGLAIAEADLATRGPGELLGSQQHGVLRLRIADLARDLDLLQEAHQRVRATQSGCPPELARWMPASGDAAVGAG